MKGNWAVVMQWLLQALGNGVVTAALVFTVGLGFWLTLRYLCFFNFAHGAMFAVAPYVAWCSKTALGFPLLLAIICAVVVTTLVSALIEGTVFRTLRVRAASRETLLVASLGVFVLFQAAIALTWGSGVRSIRTWVPAEGIGIAGARLTPAQLGLIAGGVVCGLAAWAIVFRTSIGVLVRGVGSNPELAQALGLRIERVRMLVGTTAGLIVAIAGVLTALDLDIDPQMGLTPLFLAVVPAIIAERSVLRLAAASCCTGVVYHVAALYLSARWQQAVIFGAVLAALLFVMYSANNGMRRVSHD